MTNTGINYTHPNRTPKAQAPAPISFDRPGRTKLVEVHIPLVNGVAVIPDGVEYTLSGPNAGRAFRRVTI